MSDLFTESRASRQAEPALDSEGRKQIASLRSRLTRGDRERGVVVVRANHENIDLAIARALALAVEGELAQVAPTDDGQ